MLTWSFIVIYIWHHPSHRQRLNWDKYGAQKGCFKYFWTQKIKIKVLLFSGKITSSIYEHVQDPDDMGWLNVAQCCCFVFFVFCFFLFNREKVSFFLSFCVQVGANKTTDHLCYSSSKRKLHDGCSEKIWEYNKNQIFQEVWFLKNIQAWTCHERQKRKAIIKTMTTLLTHNAVVSILMENLQKNLHNKEN